MRGRAPLWSSLPAYAGLTENTTTHEDFVICVTHSDSVSTRGSGLNGGENKVKGQGENGGKVAYGEVSSSSEGMGVS